MLAGRGGPAARDFLALAGDAAPEGCDLMHDPDRHLGGQGGIMDNVVDLFEDFLDARRAERLLGLEEHRGGLAALDQFGDFRVEFGTHCSTSVHAFWSKSTSTLSFPSCRISSISRAKRTCWRS